MGSRKGYPMEPADWLFQLEGLSMAISAADAGQEADLLRLFLDLADDVPDPGMMQGLMPPDRERIEAALKAGAMESAVLILMGRESGFCLSRGADGSPLATVLLPDHFEECTSGGASLGLACLGALIGALVNSPVGITNHPAFEIPANTLLH